MRSRTWYELGWFTHSPGTLNVMAPSGATRGKPIHASCTVGLIQRTTGGEAALTIALLLIEQAG